MRRSPTDGSTRRRSDGDDTAGIAGRSTKMTVYSHGMRTVTNLGADSGATPYAAVTCGTFGLHVALLVILLFAGCGAAGGDEGGRSETASGARRAPEPTAVQAGEAVSDAMLVTSQALYLAIAAPPVSRRVVADDGRLSLEWSEDANFMTGAGTYDIVLDGYAIAPDDPFAEHYHGYSLT